MWLAWLAVRKVFQFLEKIKKHYDVPMAKKYGEAWTLFLKVGYPKYYISSLANSEGLEELAGSSLQWRDAASRDAASQVIAATHAIRPRRDAMPGVPDAACGPDQWHWLLPFHWGSKLFNLCIQPMLVLKYRPDGLPNPPRPIFFLFHHKPLLAA